ncbi:hypothetical protein NS226_13635 [Aureimonas ureilytica]|uniref:Uncharacterized protein n=1 Tax=Aureimonas ureilytica TaxID=401562 RepID=A0A175R7T9_9HYPH|nr:hypothetical protein NS226_13635 [Aureimonas ureilytica]
MAKVEVEIINARSKLNRMDVREAQAREKAAELEKSKNLPTPAPDQDKTPNHAQAPIHPEDKPRRLTPWRGWDMPYEPEIDDI